MCFQALLELYVLVLTLFLLLCICKVIKCNHLLSCNIPCSTDGLPQIPQPIWWWWRRGGFPASKSRVWRRPWHRVKWRRKETKILSAGGDAHSPVCRGQQLPFPWSHLWFGEDGCGDCRGVLDPRTQTIFLCHTLIQFLRLCRSWCDKERLSRGQTRCWTIWIRTLRPARDTLLVSRVYGVVL